GTLSSRRLSHAHFTYSVAEVDFEVHVLHGVNASLVDGRRGDFTFHLKLRSQEVFRPESNTAFFVSKLFVQVQTIHSKSALCALKLDHFTPHKTKVLQHPAIVDVIVTQLPSADNKALVTLPVVRICKSIIQNSVIGVHSTVKRKLAGYADIGENTQPVSLFPADVFKGGINDIII